MKSNLTRPTLITKCLALAVTACGGTSAPVHDLPALETYDELATSLEAVAERLEPRADIEIPVHTADSLCPGTDGPYWTEPPGHPYEGPVATPRGRAKIQAWLTEDTDAAAQHAQDADTVMTQECRYPTMYGVGARGESELEHHTDVPEGWSGSRLTQLGLWGVDTDPDEELRGIAGQTMVAHRGPLLVFIGWEHSDAGDDGTTPDKSLLDEGMEDIGEILRTLGGDPAAEPPDEPTAQDISNQLPDVLPEREEYHPDARNVGNGTSDSDVVNAPDLLCMGAQFSDIELPMPSTAHWMRHIQAEVDVAKEDRDVDPAQPRVGGPTDAVSVNELVAVSDSAESAAELTIDLRGMVQENLDEHNSLDPPGQPESPCPMWSSTGSNFGSEENPHDGEDVEVAPLTETEYVEDGWEGVVLTTGARYESASADAGTEESAVQATVYVHRGPVTVYVRYQTGGGDDLETAIEDAITEATQVLDSLPQ